MNTTNIKTEHTFQVYFSDCSYKLFTNRNKAKEFYKNAARFYKYVLCYHHTKLSNNTCFLTKVIKFRLN